MIYAILSIIIICLSLKLIKQKFINDELNAKLNKITIEKSKLSNSVRTKGILVSDLERKNKKLKEQIED